MHYDFDVVIAAPNAAIDSIYVLSQFQLGEVNRATTVIHTAGGKGNNTARAANSLGGRVLSLGVVGGTAGTFIKQELQREGIAADFAWVTTEARRCNTILVEGQSYTTVILEPGWAVGEQAQQDLLEKIIQYAESAPYLILTGSVPADFPPSYYATLIRQIGGRCKVALDCSGDALKLGVEAGPSIVKVNQAEFQAAFGLDQWDWREVAQRFQAFQGKGVELLVITVGARGAYVFSPGNVTFRVATEADAIVSTAGAGDTFMAGLVLSLVKSNTIEDAARYASAAAAANLCQTICGKVELDDMKSYLAKTAIERLS